MATPALGPCQDGGVSQRRRLLRKGTRSCIECKRRKIRCFFLSVEDAKCVSCQRRGVTCLGQEFSAESAFVDRPEDDISRRLARFESLLAKVMDRTMSSRPKLEAGHERQSDSTASTSSSSFHSPPHDSMSSHTSGDNDSCQGDSPISMGKMDHPDKVRQALYAALPSQHDVDILIGDTGMYVGLQLLCNPLRDMMVPGNLHPPAVLTTLPSISDHPTILARALLRVALAIQQLDPAFDMSRLQTQENLQDIMERCYYLASTLVTSKDTIIDSMEGYESLILDAIYVTNRGNLRQAMVLVRRCVTLAQLMGLDQPLGAEPNLMRLDPNTKMNYARSWGRLVWGERYLALLLGMPTAIPVSPTDLSDQAALNAKTQPTLMEKMESFHAIVAGQMIQNRTNTRDPLAVADRILDTIDAFRGEFPPTYWNLPDFFAVVKTEPHSIIVELIKAQEIVTYYNLQVVLCLPYMLREGSGDTVNAKKLRCVSSTREVLTRYIRIRSFMKLVSCCRIVDFCCFTSVMALLLAHLNNHQTPQDARGRLEHELALQRLEDRATIEKALVTMDEVIICTQDPLTIETAKLIRNLLAVESDAATGKSAYNAQAADHSPASNHNDAKSPANGLDIKVPYFGQVNVVQSSSPIPQQPSPPIPTPASTGSQSVGAGMPSAPPTRASYPLEALGPHVAPPSTLPPHGSGNFSHFVDAQAQHMRQWLPADLSLNAGPAYGGGGVSSADTAAIITPAESWAFQGIDDMFFDALLRQGTENQLDWGSTAI